MLRPLCATLGVSLITTLCACGVDPAGSPSGADGGAGGATSSVTSGAGGDSTGGQGEGGGGEATCGDGSCGQGETCTSCEGDCGACQPIPCPSEGGVFCGGNGVGGDAETLYVCHGGFLEVLEACGAPCQWMPLGTPDQCPGGADEVPASLIDVLDGTPYVEQDCTPTTYAGWPYSALECTYSAGPLTATVITATPSPERVAAWIVDAASYIPALQALKGVEQAAYEEGLAAMALQVVGQSSRIFPLEGGIIENLGSWVNYPFLNGVTDGCSSGCYCRINSLHRTTWCGYQEALGQSYDDCIATVGSTGLTEGWGAQCLGNHIDAWNSDANEHFRAKAWEANLGIASACPPDQCSPGQVVDAVDGAYNPQ